jgi:cleavage and polyadenylation specificity factor subunit 6/7
MADTGVDIDLYADVDSEFPTEDFNSAANDSMTKSDGDADNAGENSEATGGDGTDLYDDVLTNIKDEKMEERSLNTLTSSTSSIPSRRYQLYVGNLTWWTTDADIADSVLSVGVNDFLEVKFYENRANGQSKGFCCISLASEASMRIVMDKLPKKEMHGQAPVVTYATKQALNQFEAQSKTRPTPPPTGQQSSMPPMGGRGPPMSHSPYRSSRPPFVGGGGRGPPLLSHAPPPMRMRGPPPSHMTHPASLPPGMSLRLPPPPNLGPPPPHMMSGPPPARVGGLLPPHHHGPAPHVNPAFFPPGGGGAPPPGYPPPVHHGLNEIEFEEIMARNRTVSSSAIARAVQDATSNDYGSAIETLVTAISLIKQSKVSHDDRCKILISSLQDTLHGIENKSYGARRERSRSRERHRLSGGGGGSAGGGGRRRSYSRERDYRGEHREHHGRDYPSYRERSRSRERDYRREDKYYEERYKHRESESTRSAHGGGEPRSSRSGGGEELERGSTRGGDRSLESRDKERERERPRH